MEINDELIGCYIEGKCTQQELQTVREYLVNNPEEYDRIVCLMDSYHDYVIMPKVELNRKSYEADYLEFSLASAAFVPFENRQEVPIPKDYTSKTKRNLQRMVTELNSID